MSESQITFVSDVIEILAPSDVRKTMLARMAKQKASPLGKLNVYAASRGFKISDFGYGVKETLIANRPTPVPPEVVGEAEPVQEVEYITQVLDLVSEDPDTQAAVLHITQTLNKSTTFEYDLFLETKFENYDFYQERTVTADGEVVLANSTWTALRDCVVGKCGPVCIGALTACAGAWSAYIACVVAACGGCAVKCVGCAACDCSWFCKPLVGCCHQ